MDKPEKQETRPRVLLVTTLRWFSTAQLALAFAEMGWEVEAACPPDHPMTRTRALGTVYPLRALRPLVSLGRAIEAAQPDLVIPTDDLAAAYLHRLRGRHAAHASRALLRRSLGPPMGDAGLLSRAAFAASAAELGIPTPQTAPADDVAEALCFAELCGYPVVLKADGTSGGEGVRVASTPLEAEAAFEELRRPLGARSALLRLILDGNRTVVLPWLLQRPRQVSVQAYLPGRDANIAVACSEGKVLASIAVEVLETGRRHGPSTVVRRIDSPAMLEAATRLVGRYGLSGLCGFDFVLDRATGAPKLIEMNGRATPICHLALGQGCDLVASLCSAATGRSYPPRPPVTDRPVVALFPACCDTDRANGQEEGVYRDVPRHEPELVRFAARSRRLARARRLGSSLLARALRRLPFRAAATAEAPR